MSLIGQQMGRYLIVELIAYGAMADVYKALDVETRREVALKVARSGRSADRDFPRRLRQEAETMKRLRHPNIVEIYEVDQHEDLSFLAMEYVNGVSLSRILEKYGRLRPDKAISYLLQACEAVQYAHERGIVHRDLKPGNLLVEQSGRVVVADFGISKMMSVEDGENTLTLVGTPIYMSPEQCGEGTLDARTDIYSLGVVLYEMITGSPPFLGDSPAAVIKAHLMESPKFSRDLWPPKLLMTARKMLAKSPQQRHPDMASLREELRQWSVSGRGWRHTKQTDGEDAPLVLCYVTRGSLRKAMASALQNLNHRMVSVTSATELLERLSREHVDMVILSHEPNRIGVFRLAEKIRASERNHHLKLFLLSQGISREEVEAAFRSGISDIIAEPFDPSVLVSKLESALLGQQRSIESRRFFRKAVSGEITVRIDSEILDISEGGMRISTNVALKIGEIVRFESKLFRELGLGETTGKVVWISKNDCDDAPAFQAGVDFINLTKAERDNLRKWIFAGEIASRDPRSAFLRTPHMGKSSK